MRFTVSQAALEKALAVVAKGISNNTTLPILSGVYLKADAGVLELQTSNLSVSIRHKIAANVEEPGATVVSGRMITNIVKNLPDSAVTFDGGDRIIGVTCEKSSYRLNTLAPEDWSSFPELEPQNSVELPSEVLSKMVDKVYRATSKDSARPVYQGIHLTVKNNTVRVVASDMLRLAFCETSVPVVQDAEFDVIVPGDAFHDVMSLAAGTQDVRMGVADNQIIFSLENTTFISRKVEGTFPDPAQLIPATCNTKVEMNVEQTGAALKRVSVIASINPTVKFEINAEEGTLKLHASTPEQGESLEVIPVEVEGASITTAFNYHYIFDCINAVSDRPTVSLELTAPTSAGIFKSNDKIDYLYLLMPVRI